MKRKFLTLIVLTIALFSTNAQTKHVVLEESTGTWCQYCPKGNYFIDSLSKFYPNFIAVAIHSNDEMMDDEYSSSCDLSAAPSAYIDRQNIEEPTNTWFEKVQAAFNHTPSSDIDVYTSFNASTRLLTVRVKASFTSAISGNYRFAAIITEDGITGPLPQYNQNNTYGGGTTVMGGFEALPNPIPANMIAFNHVARKILGGYTGQSGSVPASVSAGDTASYTFTYNIPTTWNENNIKVVGLLFKPDNSIDNANVSSYLDGNTNAKPLFISEPLATSNVGSPYVFDIYSTDPDDDDLTITPVTIPSWITVSPVTSVGSIHTKVSLTGTPTTIGNYPVEIMVSDGSRTDTLSYILVVNANFDGEWILAGDAGFTEIQNNMGIAVDTNGVIYALIGNNSICNVYRKAPDSTWTNFGNLNATGTKGYIRIGSDGVTPYIAYLKPANAVTVKKYVGGAWTQLGSFPSNNIVQFGFDLGANDVPYVACEDGNENYQGSCYYFDGTNWVKVGNNYSGNEVAIYNDLVINKANGQINVLWSNYSSAYEPTVSQWDGTQWNILGGSSVSSDATYYYQNIVIDNATQELYVSCAIYTTDNVLLNVYKFNGTTWNIIGSDINNGGIDEPKMTINDNGTLMITFVDFNHSNSLSTIIYENGAWSNIGPAGFTNAVGSNCSIASHDNTPYVLYKDAAASNKASVRYYYIEPSSVAVENFTNNNNLTIYPNPATNQITIKVNETSDNFGKIYIYNMFGSLIQTEEINQNLQQINTSNLSNGIYLITYENNGLKQNQKLLIQK